MRRHGLLLATLVLTVPLSGCLNGLFITGDEEGLPLAPVATWLELEVPLPRPELTLHGLWIPPGTIGVRIEWPEPDPTELEIGPEAGAGSGSSFAAEASTDNLLVVFGPNGERLYAGNPAMRLRMAATSHTPEITIETPRAVLVASNPPAGLYQIATHGDLTWPSVALLVSSDQLIHPILPLPVAHDRQLIADALGGSDSPRGTSGSLDPPRYSLGLVPEFIGTATPAEIRVANSDDEEMVRSRVFTSPPPGARGLAPGSAIGSWTRDDTVYPGNIDDGPWSFETEAGATLTLGWHVSGVTHEPPVVPHVSAPEHAATDTNLERTPLAGRVTQWSGAWYDHPEGALLSVSFDEKDSANRFRIYDLNGTRLAWDDGFGVHRPLALPAGRLVIVNDGFSALTAELLGPVPSDASLHSVPVDVIATSFDFIPDSGWTELTSFIEPSGPLAALELYQLTGYAADVGVQVSSAHGVLANIPRIGIGAPLQEDCCALPVFGASAADAHWLDGGRYDVRITASAAAGELNLVYGVFDFAALESADTSENRLE